jgi:hypothetical protein
MWLIDTQSLELEYFLGNRVPPYAILSHTWGDGEATFQDWQDLRKASQKTGFAKIKSACAQAQADGLGYIWVDTNCIDKSSSAELSEAINSMFAWYKDSHVCYVYLSDVEDPDDVAGNLGDETEKLDPNDYPERQNAVVDMKKARFKDSFRKSRWFTRGWTLQELLVPRSMRFFTQDWKLISRRSRHHSQLGKINVLPEVTVFGRWVGQEPLLRLVSGITGIGLDVLRYPQNVVSCSNGEKMSWIAGRETTHEEDIAYCLLGIFDINMPLLYGEGRRAFARLQEEIIKQSTDLSLFAWQWPQDSLGMEGRHPNIFADSPRLFSNWNELLDNGLQSESEIDEHSNPLSTIISLTNFGMLINLDLIPTANPDYVFGVLNDITQSRSYEILPDRELWCIPLLKIGQVYRRAPFPPGPILVRKRRERSEYPIPIPRGEFFFPDPYHYRYQYAFVILFPELETGAGFKYKSLGQIGDAILCSWRSTVFILRDVLQDGKIAFSILSLDRNETCSFLLYVGAREVNNGVETAVKLFPAGTSLATVENTQMTFRPPSLYGDECRPFSLVVSKAHRVDPVPPLYPSAKFSPHEYGPSAIFSVSLYIDQKAAEPEIEEMTKSQKAKRRANHKARTPAKRKVI